MPRRSAPSIISTTETLLTAESDVTSLAMLLDAGLYISAGAGGKLEFYQWLCRGFGLEVPGSIKRCKGLLEQIHINIQEFLDLAKNDCSPFVVKQHASKPALRKSIRRTKKTVPLRTAKKEMLQCFLINVWR